MTADWFNSTGPVGAILPARYQMTQPELAELFREGLALFPTTDIAQIAGSNWTASVASIRKTDSFGVGGAFGEYDATITASKPDGAQEPKTGMRVIWRTENYHVATVEIVANGALYVIGLNRGNPPRGT